MDITYRQQVNILAGKTPSNGGNIVETDFSINPTETITITDFNESVTHRFIIPASVSDYPLPMGTVTTAQLIVIRPSSVDLYLKFINNYGTSQILAFKADRTTVLHMELTGLFATNTSPNVIKGIYYLAGL